MFYTTQRRRRRRGQKIRHCFCMFCVCVCERNSAQKIQFSQFFRSFFFFRLSHFLMFTDVIVSTGRLSGSCMFWGRNLLWKFFFILLFHNKYKFWKLGRNLLDFFSFLGKYNRRRMWFFVKVTRSRLGWPPGLLRWRWMTFTVCVCVFV